LKAKDFAEKKGIRLRYESKHSPTKSGDWGKKKDRGREKEMVLHLPVKEDRGGLKTAGKRGEKKTPGKKEEKG